MLFPLVHFMKVILLMILLFLNRLKGWRRSRLGWLCAFSLSLAHSSVICQYFYSYWEDVLTHIITIISTYTDTFGHVNISIARKNPPLLLQSMRASFCRWRWEFPRVRWWVPVNHKKAFQKNLMKLQVFLITDRISTHYINHSCH